MTTPKPASTLCLSGLSSKRSPIQHQTFILSAILLLAGFASAYSDGNGTPANPYQIANVADLLELGADVNNYNKFFVLTADINLAGYSFNDAVIAPGNYNSPAFTGSFDGAGHKISNLTINADPDYEYYGLFGHTYYFEDWYEDRYYGSEIKNLTIENVRITTTNPSVIVGGLVGYNNGVPITNCHSTVSLIGEYPDTVVGVYFGGLAGSSSGTINNCSSEGNIQVNYTPYTHGAVIAGGLIGMNKGGDIINSHSDCNVYFSDALDIESNGGYIYLSGLVAYNEGRFPGITNITNCYSTGTIVSWDNVPGDRYSCIGGLVGLNIINNIINKCFSSSPISITIDGTKYIGGLVGKNNGEINDCFSTGPVTGIVPIDFGALGGLVGYNDNVGTIKNCYSIGEVDPLGGSGYAGGLVGDQYESSIINSYFLGTSGPDNGLGEPLSDTQMKQQVNFVGWDFLGETINGTQEIWRMCEDSIRYPLLYWQFSPADFNCPDGVNFIDFAAMANWWLFDNCATNNNCGRTDLDLSGNIDIYDLKLFCDHWLE